jgi:hypothetical protein
MRAVGCGREVEVVILNRDEEKVDGIITVEARKRGSLRRSEGDDEGKGGGEGDTSYSSYMMWVYRERQREEQKERRTERGREGRSVESG